MRDYKTLVSKWPLHWALGGNDYTGGLEQNETELIEFCKFIDNNHIKTYTEIGIAAGFLLKFMQNDMGLTVFGVTYEQRDTHIGLPVIYGKSQDIDIISKTPHSDMYFIDADHSYEAVLQDYQNYKGKCKYMAFHDILGLRSCDGVRILWEDLKIKYANYWEFINLDNSIASGIGVIKVN